MVARISSSPADEINKVRDAIISFESNATGKTALAKVVGDDDALNALAKMRLTDAQLRKIIASFIQAVEVKKRFKLKMAQEGAALRRTPKLAKAVADLRKFVDEVTASPADRISARIPVTAEEKRAYLQALYEIGRLIEFRVRIAQETPRRIGATRKSSSKEAEENAAIGWLAASIKRITGRAWTSQSRLLAGILLGIPEVSEDRLRGALRNFTDREWRQSLSDPA
jgi:hypothetical protein